MSTEFQATTRSPVFDAQAEQQVGIGVLGLHEGQTLLLGLNRAPHARSVAGCDLSEEKREQVRALLPRLFLTANYDEMLAREDVDIVAIYTPDNLHGQHIVKAFEAGKDVLCTKPVVNSIEDARLVLQAGLRTGRRLMVGQSTRFFESFQRQRDAFERGEIGAIELADAHYNHRMDWYYEKSEWAATQTDWVFLGLSHPLDLMRWYLGEIDEVESIATRSSLGQRFAVAGPDTYIVNLRSRAGQLGRVMGNYGLHELPSARNAIELLLYGSAGTSLAQYHDMRYAHSQPDGTEIWEDSLYAKRAYYFNNEIHGMHYGEFANYAEHFANAIINGEPNSPDLQEGIDVFCVMEAVRIAARSRQSVSVDDIRCKVGLIPTQHV